MDPAGAFPAAFSVHGRRCLITGGTRGIGLMVARHLAASGAHVLLSSRGVDACAEAERTVRAVVPGGAAHAFASYADASSRGGTYVAAHPCDVSTRAGCEELAAFAAEAYGGGLDVLINNAGAAWGEPLERKSGRMNWGFDRIMDLNVKAVFYMSAACLPLLEAAAAPAGAPSGRIINVGSIAGIVPQSAPTHAYDASKAAVHSLTRKLAADLAPKNITVNALAPGYVPTKMSKGLTKYGDMEEIRASVPLGRLGDDVDMAGAVIYLASRAGEWCTGTILTVDGGQTGAMTVATTVSKL